MDNVRDKFWIFTCVAGADNDWLERAGLQTVSRMTPAEGAFYLDVPNLIMVRWNGLPAHPFDQYAISFRPLEQVCWSIVGSGGESAENEAKLALDLASRFPNITGVMMDDFFTGDGKGQIELDKLKSVRDRLIVSGRRLDLWVVLYTRQLHLPVAPYLEQCDVITLWTWNSDHLSDLESNFQQLEQLSDGRKMLGCYMWDYPNDGPVSISRMEEQCETGLQWLTEGRIEGIIFLANTVCDLGLEVVEWTRKWIRKVGSRSLSTPPKNDRMLRKE